MRAPRSIDAAQVLLGLGGMLLFVSLFLDWYEPGLSAWTVFEVLDLVLAVLALVAAWMLVSSLLLESQPRDDGLLPLVGAAAFVVVASQLINHPPAAQGSSPQLGAWLGLAGSALMAVGAALSLAHVSLTISFSPRERRLDDGPAEPRRRSEPSPSTEAAAAEPEVHDELYPEQEREGPIGADDPALWSRRTPDEDDTLPFDHEREEDT